MTKVQLHFALIGKTNRYKSLLQKDNILEWSNKDTLQYVESIVTDYFGDRAVLIIGENMLCEKMIVYPKYFAAGWFVSTGAEPHELVVIAHGETMAAANKVMLDGVKNSSWEAVSVRI
jgi:hypothetical protein